MQETHKQKGTGHRASRMKLRTRVSAAFRARAHAVDARVAHAQTRDFYRSGGAEWTRSLG